MSVIQSSEFAIDCTCGEEVAEPEEAEISLLLPSALPPFLFREGVVPAAADIGMYLMNRIRLSACYVCAYHCLQAFVQGYCFEQHGRIYTRRARLRRPKIHFRCICFHSLNIHVFIYINKEKRTGRYSAENWQVKCEEASSCRCPVAV